MAERCRRSRPRISMMRRSWQFSWSWHRSELTELLAGHLRCALLIPIAAGLEAVIIWVLGGWMISWARPRWGEAAIVGAAIAVVVAVITVAIEARHWRGALWRSWHVTPHWRGGAYVAPANRRHGPMIMCVHTVPRNQGHGSQILTRICQWADEQGLTLELRPSGSAAERFYRRFGFVLVSRRVMRRECGGRPHKEVQSA